MLARFSKPILNLKKFKRGYYLTKSYVYQVCLGINNGFDFSKLIAYYKRFLYENLYPNNRVKKKLPWINFGAHDFLNDVLNQEYRVFEYGTGSSSLYYAERVKHVTSIEHDKNWLIKFQNELEGGVPSNLDIHLFEPKQSLVTSPLIYSKTDPRWIGYDFTDYVDSIEKFHDNFFDLVVIDGRARNFCVKKSIPKVKPGGYILFDNSDRAEYKIDLDEIKKWIVLESYSPTIYDDLFSRTNIYRKPLK